MVNGVTDAERSTIRLVARVAGLALRWHRSLSIVTLSLTLALAAGDFGFLYAILVLLRRAIFAADTWVLTFTLVALAVSTIMLGGLRALTQVNQDRLAARISEALSRRVFAELVRQPYEAHVMREDAAIGVALEDARTIGQAALLPLMNAVGAAFVLLTLMTALLTLSPGIVLGLIVLLAAGYWGIGSSTRRWFRSSASDLAAARNARAKIVHEAQAGFRDIVLANATVRVENEFDAATRRISDGALSSRMFANLPRLVAEPLALTAGLLLIVWFLRAPERLSGSLPMVAALSVGALRFIQMANALFSSWAQFRSHYLPLSNLLTIADRSLRPTVAMSQQAAPEWREMRLHDVSFRFGDGRPALRNIDLVIGRGERVAIVGSSGSGKSTLLDLVTGLLRPTTGTLDVDGVALRDDDGSTARWRESIGMVSQNIYLPDTTVAGLIGGGEVVPQADRLDRAIAQAELTEWVATLRDGVHTRLGEAGNMVSGGQRQRIALARAFYRGARFIVLDEATGQLDRDTEAAILDRLRALDRSYTVLFVTHRPSAIRGFDRVVRLEGGIVRGPTPDQL